MSEQFDQMLDEIYGTFKIGHLEFNASQIMKELDPIAYQVSISEFEAEEETE